MNSSRTFLILGIALFTTAVVCAFYPMCDSQVLLENHENGEGLWLNELEMQTENSGDNFRVQFILTTSTANSSWHLSKSSSLQNDTVFLILNLDGNHQTEGQTHTDTFFMGELMPGSYVVEAEIRSNEGSMKESDSFVLGALANDSESAFAEDVILYPNPALDRIHIVWKNTEPADRVHLFDTRGKLLKTYRNFSNGLDLGFCPPGIYVIVCEIGTGYISRKFTVEH